MPIAKKLSRSFATTGNLAENNLKRQHLRVSNAGKNIEAFSTMDSMARSKSVVISLQELLQEEHFQSNENMRRTKIQEQEFDEVHNYFDEQFHLNKQNDDGLNTQQDEEQEKLMINTDNFCMHITSGQLKDIIEEPEESQNNERSSSLNSQNFRRILTNEENKNISESTVKSKEESASVSNFDKYTRIIKSSMVMKKGIIFYNERCLTLLALPRLYYISNGIEKDIELNPTTSIKKLNEKSFEIINYYPTTKTRIKTFTTQECEEWISSLRKVISSFDSE